MGRVILNYSDSGIPNEIEFDDSVSFKNYTNQDFSNSEELNGKIIYASSFYQEKINSQPFNPNMQGTTFIKCNLDNCTIPEGNLVIECSQQRIQVQEDGFDWVIDSNDIPVKRLG